MTVPGPSLPPASGPDVGEIAVTVGLGRLIVNTYEVFAIVLPGQLPEKSLQPASD